MEQFWHKNEAAINIYGSKANEAFSMHSKLETVLIVLHYTSWVPQSDDFECIDPITVVSTFFFMFGISQMNIWHIGSFSSRLDLLSPNGK